MINQVQQQEDKFVEEVIRERLEKTQDILVEKAKQYARNGRLGNFDDISTLFETTPEEVCFVLVSKHIVALKDYVKSTSDIPIEQWEEKIGDIICYMCLLEAIVKRQKKWDEEMRADAMEVQ